MSGQLTLLEHSLHKTNSYIYSVLPADRKAHKNSSWIWGFIQEIFHLLWPQSTLKPSPQLAYCWSTIPLFKSCPKMRNSICQWYIPITFFNQDPHETTDKYLNPFEDWLMALSIKHWIKVERSAFLNSRRGLFIKAHEIGRNFSF